MDKENSYVFSSIRVYFNCFCHLVVDRLKNRPLLRIIGRRGCNMIVAQRCTQQLRDRSGVAILEIFPSVFFFSLQSLCFPSTFLRYSYDSREIFSLIVMP